MKFNNCLHAKAGKVNVVARASNKVTNLSCEAFLLEDLEVMVCELKTISAGIALIYKAKTGELQVILDMTQAVDIV